MLSWEMHSYRRAQDWSGPLFFDRGVPDVLGHLRLIGQPIAEPMQKAAEFFRYNRRLFIAPPWREIFHQDAERKQAFDEAARTYEALAATYAACGYELIELPRAPVAARARFLLQNTRIGLHPQISDTRMSVWGISSRRSPKWRSRLASCLY